MAAENDADKIVRFQTLREKNQDLLTRLQQGQRETWSIFSSLSESSDGEASMIARESGESFVCRRMLDGSQCTVNTRIKDVTSKTSTPKTHRGRLESKENRRPTMKSNENLLAEDGVLADSPTSILATPKSRRKKKHVSFKSEKPQNKSLLDKILHEKSLLGYDWIAGALDNSSNLLDRPDNFFENIKEFRRVNKDECDGSNIFEPPTTPTLPPLDNMQTDQSETAHTCVSTYLLNDRLFPVPIHGDYASCAVCKTVREPETESEQSYVRISVPRSSLLSPYRVKPHRRKSFDPSDTFSLGQHCLAGWEASKPAVIPAPSALDLRSTLYKSQVVLDDTGLKALSRSTAALLKNNHALRIGMEALQRSQPDTQSSPYAKTLL